jgi:putative transposase
MARAPRLAATGELHHLMQRGHNRQSVFVDDHDREVYLRMMQDAAVHCDVAIHAFALLDAEVHLLATPHRAESLSRLMQSLGRRYVAAFNRRHGRSGTLWEGRFRASVIDGASMGADALVHVELLPVRAGLATAAGTWRWSSAAHHLGRRRETLLVEHAAYWELGNTPFERELAHADRMSAGLPAGQTERFDRALMQGRALGSAQFRARIGQQTGVPQVTRPRGRPPNSSRKLITKTAPD